MVARSLRRASGNLLEVDVDAFGQRALFYVGMPLYIDDFISDAQVQGSSGSVCSSVYAVKFGQGVGVLGLEHGGIQIEKVGELETKDATRWRLWTQLVSNRTPMDRSGPLSFRVC
jgi:hypothetical protein